MADPITPLTEDNNGKVPPAVFDTSALGRAVLLGELYDQRTRKFLGVQLYPYKKDVGVKTEIDYTDLSLSLSTTHEEKADLLGVSAELSLEVLCGRVKVSGSAEYLNDENSNTNESAFALALKMRFREERLLFAEGKDKVGDVLAKATKDYVTTKLATHFVSSVVYGGNLIINLVHRSSESSNKKNVKVNVKGELNNLVGGLKIEGKVDLSLKDKYAHLNDKFDLYVHGDITLNTIPTKVTDVVELIPEAVSLIRKHKGVPIFVTLQPIPPGLIENALVYQLDANFVDRILKAFARLDDISSRFQVLQDGVKGLKNFVPELTQKIHDVAAEYVEAHTKLLHQLRMFLEEYQNKGEKALKENENEPSMSSGDSFDDKVLAESLRLCNYHLDPTKKKNGEYASNLAGLEKAFSQFQDLVFDIQKVMKPLQPLSPSELAKDATKDGSIYLSTIVDVCRAIRIQKMIPLFVMTPLTRIEPNPNLTVIRYLAIVQKHATFFSDSANPPHLLYLENLNILRSELPNEVFSKLDKPSLFIGKVGSDGDLTWSDLPTLLPDPAFNLNLVHTPPHDPSEGRLGDFMFDMGPVDATKSFSIQFSGRLPTNVVPGRPMFFVYHLGQKRDSAYLFFHANPFQVGRVASDFSGLSIDVKDSQKGGKFMMTFVQDTTTRKWMLDVRDEKSGSESCTVEMLKDVPKEAAKLQLGMTSWLSSWWNGELYDVKAFTRALSEKEISAQYLEWKAKHVGH